MPNQPILRSLRPCALTCSIALGLIPLASQADTASAKQISFYIYDIPAQPLATALLAFSNQSGLQVSAPSELLADRQAPAIQGQLSVLTVLGMLLEGSGLSWQLSDDDTVIILPQQLIQSDAAGDVRLPTLQVLAEHTSSPYQSSNTLPRSVIEALPAGNGDITSLLKTNPAVQFDNSQQSSRTPGEISPADISINGAQFYQNAFIVDGMNMNNDIDPAQEDTPYRLFAVPGRSQGLALDTDLLEEIEVLDSNVSAEYGGFNGGVVNARTRDPKRELSGSLSYQITRSEWTEYHIDPEEADDVENASSWDDGQPEFEKTTVRGTLEGYLNDDFGLLASFSQKRSEIPLSFYSSHLVDTYGYREEEQTRSINNYFLKGIWHASDRLTLRGSVAYAPEEAQYFRSNIANSDIYIESGGNQLNLEGVWQGDNLTLTQSLGWNQLEQSRTPDFDDYYAWRTSESKWWGTGNSTLEGEFGDIEQQQSGWQYKLDAAAKPINWLASEHRLRGGLEIGEDEVFYERTSESSTYVTPRETDTCTNSAGQQVDACSMGLTNNGWAGQYMSRRTRWTTGEFSFTTLSWGAWLEDDIQIEQLRIRPGVRIDSDNYMDQTTIAPRFAAEYDLFANGDTLLQAGANRYYGRNIAAWRLQEGRNRLRYNSETRASIDDDWTVGTQAQNQVSFSQLNIAYDDELMLGVVQRWNNLEFGLKYVNRKGHDQVVQVSGETLGEPSTDPTLDDDYTTWANEGKSETDIITLMVTPLQAYSLWGTSTSGQLALDWTNSKSSAPTYFDDSAGELYYENPYISYQGKFIRYADRPADNFTRPWTARLTTITQVPQANLIWSNFFRYRADYSKVADTGENIDYQGVSVDVWEVQDYGGALTWDMRLAWALDLPKQQEVFVNVDVFNVLNERSAAEVSSNNTVTYEVGRQFWLELGYRF